MASSDSLSTKSNTQSSTLHADTPESAQVQAPETHIDSPPPTDVIQSPEANTQQQSSSHSVICEPSIKKPDSDEMVIESSPDAHTSSKDNSVAAVTNNEAPDDSTRFGLKIWLYYARHICHNLYVEIEATAHFIQ